MNVGFLGLGAMGAHMARNLHKAGLLRSVWNRSPAKAEALAMGTGCVVVASPADVARDCDVLVICVSADADVMAVVEALLPAVRPGQLVIDCSTVSSATARAA